jgi:peptide/nickel transport system permease protein
MIGISMPVFWLASIFLVYLTYKTQIFPTGGYVGITENPVDWAYHLVLPWVTVAVLYVGFYSQVLRSNMLDVMHEDYVRTARAKGLSPQIVDSRHVLRNAMLPISTIIGLQTGLLLSGAVLTETVFQYPGVGYWITQAIFNRDYPVIQGGILFLAFVFVIVNLVVDVSYAFFNPRIRYSR